MSKSTGDQTEPIHVDSAEHLDELVAANEIVLVDYYADWCGPCNMLEPTIEEIAEETEAVVLKVDIEKLQEVARDRGIQSIPALEFYANGELAENFIGVQDKSDLVAVIEDLS